jgi:hypothetical protein
MKGMMVMIPAGGAERERRARRLMKEATRWEGRWLFSCTGGKQRRKEDRREQGQRERERRERGGRSSPRTHEDVQQAEETRSVPNVEDVTVQEGIEFGEEVGELAVMAVTGGEEDPESASASEERGSKSKRAHRLCFCMRVKRPFRARMPIVPPMKRGKVEREEEISSSARRSFLSPPSPSPALSINHSYDKRRE